MQWRLYFSRILQFSSGDFIYENTANIIFLCDTSRFELQGLWIVHLIFPNMPRFNGYSGSGSMMRALKEISYAGG